ncbi:MAG TPA: DNA polymerase III subunit gamma/tau [Candidatus Limnocylindrales bacterium]|nr:DNA polymerase III subunit gamma/tau [Candidatus Limnocylindrales bacterium]
MTKSASSQIANPAPHQALYRRWRAQTFAQIVGQTAVVQTLRNAVRSGRVAHAILFVGPRGTGKTSLARILAKAINCTNLQDGDPCDACPSCDAIREGRALDLVEIDAASNRGIDAIRELRERINYAPTDLRRKVYILDEAHQITKDAWNALLKSLEEPPDFVVFMFASTHPQDFPPAVLSRLQRFDVRRLTTDEIEGKLTRILESDGRAADPAAIHLIARLAAGGMRDAESMLDQLLAAGGERLDEATVRDLLGLATADAIDGYLAALVDGDVAAGVRILDSLEDRGRDLRAFLDQVVDAVRSGLLGGTPGASAGPAGAHAVTDLVRIARRLGAIDPNRAGIGGLRLQMELALFPDESTPSRSVAAPPRVALTPVAPTPPAATPPSPAATPPRATPTPRGSASAAAKTPPTEPSAALTTKPVVAEPGTARPVDLGAPPGSDLATLRQRWPEVVTRISQHPPTKPLIAVCRPISVEDGIVTLGFPEDQGFLRAVAERRRTVLEEGIAAVLGHPIGVRCVATNLDLLPELPADADAAYVLAEARRIFGSDESDAAEVS